MEQKVEIMLALTQKVQFMFRIRKLKKYTVLKMGKQRW